MIECSIDNIFSHSACCSHFSMKQYQAWAAASLFLCQNHCTVCPLCCSKGTNCSSIASCEFSSINCCQMRVGNNKATLSQHMLTHSMSAKNGLALWLYHPHNVCLYTCSYLWLPFIHISQRLYDSTDIQLGNVGKCHLTTFHVTSEPQRMLQWFVAISYELMSIRDCFFLY